ncbi:hypothetical protein CDD80_3962 [Ophiocordyceps camponoti-rufipedis]|uniref:Uncharacterized protein n=1 Tax=Ophiocordyceps camponoti-rufipedis TaxID=2004952 RepID=A0A2C5XVK9_9HYPO|nr:hypothetical protein CDD80_3962 [Ophiocordyceps camponoti-rufipedis]
MEACCNVTMMSTASSWSDQDDLAIARPPWTLVGDFYILYYWIPASQAANLPPVAFSPLEAASGFAHDSSGRPLGGIGIIQIIRYHTSPVDWNIPKHLAKFEWERNHDGSQTVKVFPHDTSADSSEANPSVRPLFRATMKPVPYVPSFPFSTDWLKYVGISSRAVHPPLPEGKGSPGEIPGTDCWRICFPTIKGWTDFITLDMAQGGEDQGAAAGDGENFWPGLGRWHVGMRMKDAVMTLGPAEEI